ncbi:MAG: DUF192 domain-containing protein [Gammaproteobacteria bacterium]|nr:DUF192 domain-containing protein [Gammaproteobacteria bacterium]MCK5498649.1 DUF192 domain-containing protein [Gammaproteobacteria bacterium]
MKVGSISRQDNQQCLLNNVMCTSNPFERMRGLLGKPPLQKDQALLITSCSSVHTFGMVYPIGLVFLDRHWQIKKIVKSLVPWRIAWSFGSNMVLEMTPETIESLNLDADVQLLWEEKECVQA